ncbi:hypothetical protein [Aestuariibacter salexigens]|uniref:hypothetical protein n=1 Tax=Aestuariibacter salexigens TaxID=226010 RepID=UPI0004292188|nr:hypothetical protein [Aestuariibacter salexigens]
MVRFVLHTIIVVIGLAALTLVSLRYLYSERDQSLNKSHHSGHPPVGDRQKPTSSDSKVYVNTRNNVATSEFSNESYEDLFEEANLNPQNYNSFQLNALDKAKRGARLSDRELSDLLSFLVDREFHRAQCLHPNSEFRNTEAYDVISNRNYSIEHWKIMSKQTDPTVKIPALLMLANLFRKANWLEEYENVIIAALPYLEKKSQYVLLSRLAKTLSRHARFRDADELKSRLTPYLFILMRDYDDLDKEIVEQRVLLSEADQTKMLSGVEALQHALVDRSWQEEGDKLISVIPVKRPKTEQQAYCESLDY